MNILIHVGECKHISEQRRSSMRVFFSILAHLDHLAQSIFLILTGRQFAEK